MFSLIKERIDFDTELGEGAFGAVYPYQKNSDDLKWVVKFITAPTINKLLTCLPEIVLGFSCDHPCIVPIKGYYIEKAGQVSYNIYLKLPRMRKETLKDKFLQQRRSNQPFPEQEIVKYFYSMVCAIDYLHKKKIYHQDIKPSNILFDENWNAMLSDIGVAKLVGDEERYDPLTGQGGTIDYTAPELLKDRSNLKKENLVAGDAWSLGLVMLEFCKLDNRLFYSCSSREDIEKAQESLYQQLLKNNYSEKFLELIFKLLKFEPKERIKICDLKQSLETEYKCRLNSELKHESEERKTERGMKNVNDLPMNDKKSDQNVTLESLLQENSQLQIQLREQRFFLNQFQSEMLTELQNNENETVKKLLANYQDTLKKLNLGDEIEIDLGPIQKQDEESLLERNNMSQNSAVLNESDKEEKKKPQEGHSTRSQVIALREKKAGRNKFLSEEVSRFDDLAKIVFFGFSGVGKSILIQKFMSVHFDWKIPHHRGMDFYTDLALERDEKRLKFQVWDSCGSERFWPYSGSSARGSSAIIMVYDMTNRDSFDRLPDLIEVVKDHTEDSFLFIVGNKLDRNSERKVSKKEAEEFAQKHGGFHFEVSAKTKENIDELREQLADAVWEKYVLENSKKIAISEKPATKTLPSHRGSSQKIQKKTSFWNFFG